MIMSRSTLMAPSIYANSGDGGWVYIIRD
jgi:hypothetical protein